ncbi:MAG: GNAT family N-acetyltransferase [Saprospirales bacterium]|nr:MAG: GNAT family N-acetyltransferase [Saprospirales bacterium]
MEADQLDWILCTFDQLSKRDLYEVLKLRSEVFVVEQECPYQDMDGFDFQSLHYLVVDGDQMIAYSRILPPDLIYRNFSSIGRVITKRTHRKIGLGRKLMEKSLQLCRNRWPENSVKIMAQSYLLDFYKGFGFLPVGEEFLEDDIPHRHMILQT